MRNPRKSFEKAIRKLRPSSAQMVLDGVDELISRLEGYGFKLVHKPTAGIPPFWDLLRFQRDYSSEAYDYINVGFADNGDLSFGCDFGIREYAEPYEWICSADLSKRRAGLWRTCDLGAWWFLPFKEQMFARDWQFFMSNIDDIVWFLETGKPNKNIIDVEVDEHFQPRRAT